MMLVLLRLLLIVELLGGWCGLIGCVYAEKKTMWATIGGCSFVALIPTVALAAVWIFLCDTSRSKSR
jgi:hypothetical protein